MNWFGVYHQDYVQRNGSICDAPCVSKGRMMLCAYGSASEDGLIAMTFGRLCDRRALAAALDCPADAEPAWLALRAYRKWGTDYPRHMEGTVVTCVMDAAGDSMVLSRDRMGEQPVFYARRGDKLAFADHPDTLLKNAAAEPVMDLDGLRELFGLGPARTPGRTFIRDIAMLEPGCALILEGERLRVDRYFEMTSRPHEDDERTTIDTVRGLLEQAVDDVAGLNPAVMLSGGLDSTALTALLARRRDGVMSFSVDYQDNDRDFRANAFRPEMDAPYVQLAARACHTQHRTVVLDSQSLASALGRAVSLRGFPGMADIDTSLLLFSRDIARYARNVVSGECGDEVFCGYPWFRGEAALGDVFPWSGSMELRESLLKPELRERLKLTEYVKDLYAQRVRQAEPDHPCDPKERRMKIMQKLCFDYFMTNLQERAVRMCEGAGVRVLTPLCDPRLAEYVYNVPWEMKFMGGQEKGLFREAVKDLLPEKLLRRTKSPYPKTCSPQYAQIIRQTALRLTMDAEAPIFTLLDRERVAEIARGDMDPAATPWFGQLMAGAQLLGYLWQVNRWMRERNIAVEV
ncbi:MAG: asparagine synthetase B [Clostridia bacterium]|nr:asparagine synthetase B [Clostridia bacterium]